MFTEALFELLMWHFELTNFLGDVSILADDVQVEVVVLEVRLLKHKVSRVQADHGLLGVRTRLDF